MFQAGLLRKLRLERVCNRLHHGVSRGLRDGWFALGGVQMRRSTKCRSVGTGVRPEAAGAKPVDPPCVSVERNSVSALASRRRQFGTWREPPGAEA